MGHYNKSTNKTCNGRRKKNAGAKSLKLFREKKRLEDGAHSSACSTSRDTVVINELDDSIDDHPLEICPETNTNDDYVAVNNITGRRIVDLAHLLDSLQSIRHEGFGCSFFDMNVIGERAIGFQSLIKMKCNVCNLIKCVATENIEGGSSYMNINSAAVNATITIGAGYRQLQQFCSALDIPVMSSRTFVKHENAISQNIMKLAQEEMKLAGQEEARIAREKGDVDKKGNAIITVTADGAWSKRSYRRNYSALSGVATIVGLETKKVLYVGIKNRYCMICDDARYENRKESHTCYKNWSGSATGMEAAGILEGFKISVEQHGLVYGRLVGDGDSSVFRKICEALPYGTDTVVEKIECTNHILRNMCHKIRDLKNKTKYRITYRNNIVENVMRFRNGVTCAIAYRRSEQGTMREKSKLLEKDILNSIYHILGDHKNCEAYFCSHKEDVNLVPEYEQDGIFNELQLIIQNVANHSNSLILYLNNNAVESFNSYVAKVVGGKRINFSRRGSYQTRCALAVTECNTDGQYLKKLINLCTGQTPGHYTEKYCAQELRRIENRRSKSVLKAKSKRKNKAFTGPDDNYGFELLSNTPDITEDEYQKRKTEFLQHLMTDETALEENTRGQSKSLLWRNERLKRLTASIFGKIINLRQTTPRSKVVEQILYNSFMGNKATRYGHNMEAIAKETFEKDFKVKVDECGMFLDSNLKYLSASPDGIIKSKDSIIEIKCPFSSRHLSVYDAVLNKKIMFLKIDKTSKQLELKKNHAYFYQVQGQLQILNKEFAYFLVYTTKDYFVEVIYRDRNVWNDNVDKLKDFYFNYLLPEIIDPRKARGLPLRPNK